MSAVVKTSACVDCATPIIGEQLRCPACHDRHAVGLLASDVGDDDMTRPRDRAAETMSVWQSFVAWFGAVLIVAAVVVLMIAGRSCQ